MSVRWQGMFCGSKIVGAVVLFALKTGAAHLETHDGKLWRGEFLLQRDQVRVQDESGQTISVPWREVARACFVDLPTASTPPNRAWRSRDIGEVFMAGNTTLTNDRFVLTASGWGLWPSADALRFTSVPLPGEGQIKARVAAWHDSNGTVRAGLSIRQDWTDQALHASLFISSTGSVTFVARGDTNFVRRETGMVSPKSWLRMTRTLNYITGYLSEDGEHWEPVDQIAIGATHTMQAGIIGCTTINTFLGAAELEKVSVSLGALANDHFDLPAPSVVLREGSVLAGPFLATNDAVMLTCPDGSPLAVPLTSIAAILAGPVSPTLVFQPEPGARTGLMLKDHDWLEAEIKAISRTEITVSSILFGPKKLAWSQDPVAVMVAGLKEAPQGWHLRLKDRSLLRVSEIQAEPDRIQATHPALGLLQIPRASLLEIRAPD